MQILYAILIAGALIGVNVYLYALNSKTPVPEGCEDIAVPDCHACGMKNCELRSKYQKMKEEKDGNH